jgi:hypothetical protein
VSRSAVGGLVEGVRDERGQVLWLTGLLVFAFIGLAGLTTDVGVWLTGDRIAQKGADGGSTTITGTFSGIVTSAPSCTPTCGQSFGVSSLTLIQ